MFPPKKILFPVDFSDRCTAAARMVETFTGHFQAEVTLLHVLELPAYNDVMIETAPATEQRLQRYLTEELEQFNVRRELLEGDPAAQITAYAHAQNIDLIMLPTHGYAAFRRVVLGSVTSKVLRDACCPVWTGVHMEHVPKLEDIAFRKVVCALDLGQQSCPTLRWATAFASEFGASVHIVHALPAARDVSFVDEELIRQASATLKTIENSAGSCATVSIIPDEVAAAVCGSAEREKADLVVIGRSVHDGVLGRLRANAYSIIRQSPCPVVSV
jgi:nucleotide-binding universal stress UspA family protein